MSRERKQLLVLVVLLAVLAVVWLRRIRPSEPGGSDAGAVLAELDAGTLARAAGPVAVRFAALEREPGSFSPGRDPFRFHEPPPPPPQREEPVRPAPRPVAESRPQEVKPATPPGPRPPDIDFMYLGSFGPSAARIAVFSDQNEIYNAREGDVIKKQFVVVKIGYESADIGFVRFPDVPARRLAVGG